MAPPPRYCCRCGHRHTVRCICRCIPFPAPVSSLFCLSALSFRMRRSVPSVSYPPTLLAVNVTPNYLLYVVSPLSSPPSHLRRSVQQSSSLRYVQKGHRTSQKRQCQSQAIVITVVRSAAAIVSRTTGKAPPRSLGCPKNETAPPFVPSFRLLFKFLLVSSSFQASFLMCVPRFFSIHFVSQNKLRQMSHLSDGPCPSGRFLSFSFC